MNTKDMFPSRFLHGSDLKGPVTVTVAAVNPEEVYKPGKGKTLVYVLYCEKATRGVVLNKTLVNQIGAALGDDTDNWPGGKIVLYPEPVKLGPDTVMAIRAKAAQNGGQA